MQINMNPPTCIYLQANIVRPSYQPNGQTPYHKQADIICISRINRMDGKEVGHGKATRQAQQKHQKQRNIRKEIQSWVDGHQDF